MKIFLSWSDDQSKAVASALDSWLPNVLQSVDTFFSQNIEKGTRGGAEINAALENTNFGILCLNRNNLDSRWIHYEAGALAKINDDDTRVWTLLQGITHADVKHPLAQFQHTFDTKVDVFKLVQSINSKTAKPLASGVLEATFDKWWPDLEQRLRSAETIGSSVPSTPPRSDREVLDEILETLRGISKRASATSTVAQSIKFTLNIESDDPDAVDRLKAAVERLIAYNLAPDDISSEMLESNGQLLVSITLLRSIPLSHGNLFITRLRDKFGSQLTESYLLEMKR